MVVPQQVARSLAASFLLLLFIMYLIVLALAGWVLNQFFDRGYVVDDYSMSSSLGSIEYTFALMASIAGVVGMASVLAGCHHLHAWRGESGVAAASSSLIAWLLILLAFGMACKEINSSAVRGSTMETLEAFVIILALFQLMYLILLHAGLFSKNYGPGYYKYVVEPPPTTSYGPQMIDVKPIKTPNLTPTNEVV